MCVRCSVRAVHYNYYELNGYIEEQIYVSEKLIVS